MSPTETVVARELLLGRIEEALEQVAFDGFVLPQVRGVHSERVVVIDPRSYYLGETGWVAARSEFGELRVVLDRGGQDGNPVSTAFLAYQLAPAGPEVTP